MDIQPRPSHLLFATSPRLRLSASLILLISGVSISGTLCATGNYRGAAAIALAVVCAALLVCVPISVEAILITWFATTPLASFYVRFPTDRSIITFNRLAFALLVALLLLKSIASTRFVEGSSVVKAIQHRARFSASKFEIAWSLLSILALASAAAMSNNVASAVRTAVDTFWLPLVAFNIARNHFDARNNGRRLLLCGIALALFLFAVGSFEFATGADLFQYKGSEIEREGERRVNGPFLADSSYAIVCLLMFILLRAAPRIFRLRFDRTGKLIYTCALAAAALGSLLSMFRAVAVALVICWIILQWFSKQPGSHRRAILSPLPRGALLGALIVLIFGALVVWNIAPSTLGRLSNPRTAFGRLATWQAAAEIAAENPLFGVGLGNYAEHFDSRRWVDDEPIEEVLETRASNSPHSNVLWIAAELGVAGVALYIAANLYLFAMGWRALKLAADRRQRTTASCFLALFIAYWIPGLTLTSGGYSDLNLYFLFLLGALSSLFPRSRQAAPMVR